MSKNDKKSSKSEKKAQKAEFHRAMDRLEDAVRELGDAAKDNFADRAAQVLEQTAAKLKNEGGAGSRSAGAADEDYSADERSSSDGYRANFMFSSDSDETGKLGHWRGDGSNRPFRDLDNGKLWGICAGVAPYLGLEVWVVRCLAVTMFIFAPQIIVPAYIIGYFVLDARSDLDVLTPRSTRRQRKRHARRQKAMDRAQERSAARAAAKAARAEKRSRRSRTSGQSNESAPPQPAARAVLRDVRGTLNEAEARLRRMEGHVTSGRYELQKELRKIEGAPS